MNFNSKNIKRNLIINQDSTVQQAMARLSLTGKRELIVQDKKNKLLGSLSDGDIRNHLINNNNLNQKVFLAMNKKPKFLSVENINIKKLFEFFKQNLSLIPVLNKKKEIIMILEKSTFVEKLSKLVNDNNLIVIMSGGKGTRMKPFTKVMPKALFPISNTTVLEKILFSFINHSFFNFLIVINFQKELIKKYFKINKYNFPIKFLEEKKALGTVGALSMIKLVDNQRVVLVNCDTLFNFNYRRLINFHIKKKSDLTIVISNNDIPISYGVCNVDKNLRLTGFEEKPVIKKNINVGFYIIEKKIVNLIPKNQFYDIDKLIKKAIRKKMKIYTYVISESSYTDYGKWE